MCSDCPQIPLNTLKVHVWALLAIYRTCNLQCEEAVRKAFRENVHCVVFILYPLVSECVHVGGVRRQISCQRVRAAHISFAQVICIVTEIVSQYTDQN